ncbi:MAG: peptide MFS transporter [Francisellaceae bacterium]
MLEYSPATSKAQTHPPSLWILSGVYACFTLALGVCMANLLLYFNHHTQLGNDHSFQVYAAFNSLAFTLPLIGGLLCDKFGFRNTATIGLGLSFIGLAIFAIPSEQSIFLGLAVFLVGNLYCTPAIWSLITMLYERSDSRRDSGSTIFYMLFNIGFLLANLTSGFVGEAIGWHLTFLLYGTPSLIAFFVFFFLRGKIKTHEEVITGERRFQRSSAYGITWLLIWAIILTPVCYILLNFVIINDIILWSMVLVSFVYIWHLSMKHKKNDSRQSGRLKAFLFLCIVAMAYLIIFNSEFGLLPVFAENNLNREIAGITFPGEIITSLDPAYCIVIGLFYSWLWVKLDKYRKNPSLPTKFTWGLIFAACGYLLLSLILFNFLNIKFSILWLFLVFLLFVAGELLVVPIGIAMVGKLSPEGHEGLLMGIWNLMTGAGALLTGYIASFTVIPKSDTLTQSNLQYLWVFLSIGIVVLIIGLFMLWVKKFIIKLI